METRFPGIVESFNFAENGRHLANQNYKACVRQSKGMCSIAYEPCDDESFRIGPSLVQGNQYAMGNIHFHFYGLLHFRSHNLLISAANLPFIMLLLSYFDGM